MINTAEELQHKFKTYRDLKVGDVVYVYDANLRKYVEDDGVTKSVSTNPWLHWKACVVTGENIKSWIVGGGNPTYGGFKISKSRGTAQLPHAVSDLAYSREEIESIETQKMSYSQIDFAFRKATLEQRVKVLEILGLPEVRMPENLWETIHVNIKQQPRISL